MQVIFPESGRRRHERDLVAGLIACVQTLAEMGALDPLGQEGRTSQFCLQQPSVQYASDL